MKKFFALVAVGLLILGAASCDTKNIGNFGTVNVAPSITSATFNPVDDTLVVGLSDPNAADIITVTCSVPAGLAVDNPKTFSKTGSVTFHWTATNVAAGGNGTTTITATDGVLSATATADITVDPATPNDPPVITSHPYNEATATLTVNVTDPDAGDTLTVSVTSPAGLTPDAASKTAVGGVATFTWTGAPGTTGDTTISVSDGHNAAVTATQTISIGSPNAAPTFTQAWVDNGDGTGTLTVTVADADNDPVSVSITAVAGLTANTLTGSAPTGNGPVVFDFTADVAANGGGGNTTITANDGHNADVTATQAIAIAAVVTNGPPVIVSHNYADPTLTVVVTDPDTDPVTVTVSVPAGLAVDNAAPPATAGGGGTVNFVWSATDPFVGGTGDTTITANDGQGHTVTATQTITVAPWPLAADTLYARPASPTAAVGAPVTIYVYTGQPANPLQFLSSVGFTIENAGTYTANSFNNGWTGGARMDTDGYWALMGPPAPTLYLDLGDGLMPGAATDIGGGLHRYNFAVVPQGSFTAPAAVGTGTGPFLFSFTLTFSAAGTYHLAFQQTDAALFDQTYYSDGGGTNYFWGTLDSSNTITVN